MEEVRIAHRTDPFTVVIADLISAGAKNGAEVKALPSDVKAELITMHSEQRVWHARRQIHSFMANVDGVLQSGDRISGTRRGAIATPSVRIETPDLSLHSGNS